MVEIFKIFILSTISITLWTAFLLSQDKRGIPKLNRWFAVFLFAQSLIKWIFMPRMLSRAVYFFVLEGRDIHLVKRPFYLNIFGGINTQRS